MKYYRVQKLMVIVGMLLGIPFIIIHWNSSLAINLAFGTSVVLVLLGLCLWACETLGVI